MNGTAKMIDKPGQVFSRIHVDDIAGAVYFFCSEDSKYVTGQTLLVDGGVSVTF